MCEFRAILDHLITGGKFGLFTGAYLPPDEQIVTQAMELMDKHISLDELKKKNPPKELFIVSNQTMYEPVEKQGLSQTSVA